MSERSSRGAAFRFLEVYAPNFVISPQSDPLGHRLVGVASLGKLGLRNEGFL